MVEPPPEPAALEPLAAAEPELDDVVVPVAVDEPDELSMDEEELVEDVPASAPLVSSLPAVAQPSLSDFEIDVGRSGDFTSLLDDLQAARVRRPASPT
ncbi:MAG: hypothetical protein ACF8XB_04485 [Planctomycetota bacterium JB042]